MLRQAVLWLFDLSLAVLASGQVYSAKSIVRRSANSWFSNLERRERAAHRAKSPRQIQGADPGHDPPDTGDQPTAADRRPHAIPHRMARLLRLLPDPACAHQPGSVDSPKTTLVSLAAVAERAQPLQRTAPSWRIEVQCSGPAGSPTGFWRMSGHPAVQQALRNHYFVSLRLPRLHVSAQA